MSEENRYTINAEPHGSGGFGKIHHGRDNSLQRDIAIKVLTPSSGVLEAADIERFKREARILAALNHPSIPSIYDVDWDDVRFQILLQFIKGRTFQQILEQDKVSFATAKGWILQVCSALEYAHESGVIHRDVNPKNVIVADGSNVAYLVDFGLALSKADCQKLTKSGYVIGTLGYMSPEHMAGEDLDVRADIFSLGVTFYELLAGNKIPVGDYEPLALRDNAIPPQVDELILNCLEPKASRIRNVAEFRRRLNYASMTNRPLSEVLSQGRLHDISAALAELSASELLMLPAGQRALILLKIEDVINSTDERILHAGEDLLELILVRGVLLPPEEFRDFSKAGYPWGFRKKYGLYEGSGRIRAALVEAAMATRGPNFEGLAAAAIDFFEHEQYNEKQGWYLNGLRDVIQALLANQSCGDEHAGRLARILKVANAAQKGLRATAV